MERLPLVRIGEHWVPVDVAMESIVHRVLLDANAIEDNPAGLDVIVHHFDYDYGSLSAHITEATKVNLIAKALDALIFTGAVCCSYDTSLEGEAVRGEPRDAPEGYYYYLIICEETELGEDINEC